MSEEQKQLRREWAKKNPRGFLALSLEEQNKCRPLSTKVKFNCLNVTIYFIPMQINGDENIALEHIP